MLGPRTIVHTVNGLPANTDPYTDWGEITMITCPATPWSSKQSILLLGTRVPDKVVVHKRYKNKHKARLARLRGKFKPRKIKVITYKHKTLDDWIKLFEEHPLELGREDDSHAPPAKQAV